MSLAPPTVDGGAANIFLADAWSLCLRPPDRKQRNLRRAVEPYRKLHRADSSVRIERQTANLVQSPDVLPRQIRQIQRADQRKLDLSSVRVPRKLQVDGKARDVVGIIRFVRHQDGRLICGNSTQSAVHISSAAQYVIHTAEPETRAVFFDRY